MTKITKLSVSRLNKAEFIHLISSSLDSLDKNGLLEPEDQMVRHLIERLQTNLPDLASTIQQRRYSDRTKEIQIAKKARNKDIHSLKVRIQSYRHSRQLNQKKADERLLKLLQEYKNIQRSSMEEASILTTSLLNKLQSPAYTSLVEELAVQDCVNNLKQSQDDFYKLYLERSKETLSRDVYDYQSLRKTVQDDYQLLYSYLTSRIKYNANVAEKPIFQLLNDIRQEHADNVRRRKKKAGVVKSVEEKAMFDKGAWE